MRKLLAAALAAGILTVSCSGHSGSGSVLPQAGQTSVQNQPSKFGTHGVRAASLTTVPLGWAATSTQAISLLNATDLGPVSATQSMTVRLGLQLHNVDQLNSLVQSGQTLSPDQFMATYAPTASDVQAAMSFLQNHGITGVTVEPNNLVISATATAAQVSSAFNTTLHNFSQNGVTVYANTAPAYVPTALSGIVVSVLGLNNAQAFKAGPHRGSPAPSPTPTPVATPTPTAPSPCSLYGIFIIGFPSPQPEPTGVTSTTGCLRNYRPADYWRAYNAMNVPAATGVNVAIMAEGAVQQSINDLRVNEQGDGLTQVPVVVKQVGLASTDTAGVDEWTLDMTASSGMAGAVKTIYLYDTTSLTDSDIALEYNHWVTDHLARIGNSSFGGCEAFPFLDGSMVLDDEILLQGAAEGMTMFASSGDTGSFCSVGNPNGVPAGVPLVEYPAASPYVVAVGGTTLITQTDGSYQGEASWDAGGGGISQFEYSPYWQQKVQPADSTGAVGFRGVPDVAMDADLQTGMILYASDFGGWAVIGGTSLASPLSAGVWARMLQVHPSLGYAAPRLYHMYATTPGADLVGPPPTRPYGGFHDILAGGNGTYTALPGYDYTTGLGTYDVGATNALIGL